MPRPLDLTGRRFGRYVVTGPAPSLGGGTRWHVRCDCGNDRIAAGKNLSSGSCTSCGCSRLRAAPRPAPKPKPVPKAPATSKRHGADDAMPVMSLSEGVITPLGVQTLAELWVDGRLRAVLWTRTEPDGTERRRYFLRTHKWGDGWHGWRVARHVWELLVTEVGGDYDRHDNA